jgi:hypothetical protein
VEKLVGLAKLDGVRKTATNANPDLFANWLLAQDWSEEKRYHRIDKTGDKNGVSSICFPETKMVSVQFASLK